MTGASVFRYKQLMEFIPSHNVEAMVKPITTMYSAFCFRLFSWNRRITNTMSLLNRPALNPHCGIMCWICVLGPHFSVGVFVLFSGPLFVGVSSLILYTTDNMRTRKVFIILQCSSFNYQHIFHHNNYVTRLITNTGIEIAHHNDLVAVLLVDSTDIVLWECSL